MAESAANTPPNSTYQTGAINVATISAGFEKGDFLVREEQGNRVYFDFFEEAFNYIANKGYSRMSDADEKHWTELLTVIHESVKGGMKYNTGTLLMVLSRPVGTVVTDVSDNASQQARENKSSKLKSPAPMKQEPPKN